MPFQLYIANAGTNITLNNMKRLTQFLWPPKTKDMSDLMLAGFMDCSRFLSYYGITDRALSCLTVESHLYKPIQHTDEVGFNKSFFLDCRIFFHISITIIVFVILIFNCIISYRIERWISHKF